jgi:hypothetical protein
LIFCALKKTERYQSTHVTTHGLARHLKVTREIGNARTGVPKP